LGRLGAGNIVLVLEAKELRKSGLTPTLQFTIYELSQHFTT
jgi:hypothetical protein